MCAEEYVVMDAIEYMRESDISPNFIHLDDAWGRPKRGKDFGVYYPTHDFETTCKVVDLCMELLEDGGWLVADSDDWLLPRLINYIRKTHGDVTEDYQGGGYRKVGWVTYVNEGKVSSGRSGMYLSNGGYPVIFVHKGKTDKMSSESKSQIARRPKNFGWCSVKPIEPYRRWIKALTNEGDLVFEPFAGTAPATIACGQLGRRAIAVDCQEGAFEAYEKRNEKYNRPSTNSLI